MWVTPRELPAVSGGESARVPVLPELRHPPRPAVPVVWGQRARRRQVLRLVRNQDVAAGRVALRLARGLHAATPRRADPHVSRGAGRRAQAGDGALRRPQGLDGASRRAGSGGGRAAARPRPRAHDGGRPPLRGHGEPDHERRDHGALRRAARARGPRGAGVLRGAPDARRRPAILGRAPRRPRGRGADPRRGQLRRSARAIHQQRSAHGLHGGRTDHPPRGANGAARASRQHPHHRRHAEARRGLRDGERPRARAREGAERAGRGLRAHRGRRGPHALSGVGPPRALAIRGPRQGDGDARRRAHRRGRRPWPARGAGRRAGRREVAPLPRVRPLGADARMARGPGGIGLVRDGDPVPARHRSPEGLLPDR